MTLEQMNKLEGLKFLAGSVDTADLFNNQYEALLKDARTTWSVENDYELMCQD